MSEKEYAYIGVNENGLARAIVFDDPKYKKDTAKTIAGWIKNGRTIERLEIQKACDRLRQDWPATRARASERQETR